LGNEDAGGSPLFVETADPEGYFAETELLGNWTTPNAGKINARQLLAQIRIKPVNFIFKPS
jgi:hypothetical protein